MSIKNCFRGSNKLLNSLLDEKVSGGLTEEEAAIAAIREYSATLTGKLTALTGEKVNPVVIDSTRLTTMQDVTTTTEVVERLDPIKPVAKASVVAESLAAKRNRLFDLFYNTINDPKYYAEMMTSIDNDTFRVGTLSMLDNSRDEQAYDVFDPIRVMTQRFAFKLGGAGVGMAANGHSDHILTQGKEVEIHVQQGEWGNEFLDAEYSEALSDDDLAMLGEHINEYLEGAGKEKLSTQQIEKLRAIKIGGTLSELINAFVDIANEQAFVARGNWSALLNDYGMALIRAGVHPHKVSAMLAQPVLRKLAEDISNKEGIISNTSSKDIEADLLDDLLKLLDEKSDQGVGEKEYNALFNGPSILGSNFELIDLLTSVRKPSIDNLNAEELRVQISVLKHYIQTKGTIRKYGNFVLGAKVDAKGAGRSLAEMMITMNRVADSLEFIEEDGGIRNGWYKYYDDNGVPTQVMKMYENTVGFMNSFMESNSTMFNGMTMGKLNQFQALAASSRNNPRLTEKSAVEFLFKAYDLYKLSKFEPLSRETSDEKRIEMRLEISRLKRTGDYSILNKLLIDKDGEYFLDSASRKDVDLKNQMTDSWRALLHNNKEVGDFLVRESYRTSQFRPGPKQYHELIPFEWFSENRYEEFSEGDVTLTDDFVKFSLNLDISDLSFFKYIKTGIGTKEFTLESKEGTTRKVNINYAIVSLNRDSFGLGGIKGFLKNNKQLNRPPKYASINASMSGKLTQIVKTKSGEGYFAVYSDFNGKAVQNNMVKALFLGQEVEVTNALKDDLLRETPKFVDLNEMADTQARLAAGRKNKSSSVLDDLNCKLK